MALYKIHRRKNFAHLPNEVLEDARISFRARGILAYLLSRPDDWRPNADHLQSISATEGRKSVLTAMKELEEVGYIERRRVRGEDGRIATVTDVYDRDRATRQADGDDAPEPVDNAATEGEEASSPESPEGTPVDGISAGQTGGPSPNVGGPDAGAPNAGLPDVGGGHSLIRTEDQERRTRTTTTRASARRLAPVDDDGGGGGDPWTEHLTAIAEQLDTVDRARLAGETGDRLHRLTVVLRYLEHDGWGPDVCAEALTRGSLEGAGSVAAVLEHRAQQLRRGAKAAPPTATKGPSAAVPKAVLAELDKRAAAAAFTDAGGIDPDRRAQVLDELAAAWLEQEGAASA